MTLASFALNFVEKNSFFLLIFARFNNLLRNGIWLLGVVLFQPFFFERTERLSIEEFRFFFWRYILVLLEFFHQTLDLPILFFASFFLREKGNDFRSRNAVIGFYFQGDVISWVWNKNLLLHFRTIKSIDIFNWTFFKPEWRSDLFILFSICQGMITELDLTLLGLSWVLLGFTVFCGFFSIVIVFFWVY